MRGPAAGWIAEYAPNPPAYPSRDRRRYRTTYELHRRTRSLRSHQNSRCGSPRIFAQRTGPTMKKIAVVTTSRADYSLLYWPLRDLAAHPEVDLKIIALGPHLSPEFGHTLQEIEKDGFPVDARIECLVSSDSDVGM